MKTLAVLLLALFFVILGLVSKAWILTTLRQKLGLFYWIIFVLAEFVIFCTEPIMGSGLDSGQTPEANYYVYQTKNGTRATKKNGAGATKKRGAERAPWIVKFSFSSYIVLCRDS
jgi:hypothetical protein